MANDGPSGDKNNKLPTGKKAGRPEQLDLSALREQLAPALRDPADEFVTTQATRPGAAAQTPGPHRYTIFVPKDDKTILNLGQGIGPLGVGISALTQTTVLAYATGEIKTALSLGAATASGLTVNATTDGYALETTGDSFHVADKNVAIFSMEKSMTLKSKEALTLTSTDGQLVGNFGGGISLATPGKLSISVGTPPSPNFTLGGVAGAVVLSGADVWDIANPAIGTWAKPPADGFSKSQLAADMGNLAAAEAGEVGGTTWGKPLLENSIAIREWAFSQAGTITDKVLLHAATITSFVMSFRKFSKQVDAGTSKWKSWDGGSLAIAAAAEVLKLYQDFWKKKSPEDAPEIGIKSEGTIEIEAGKSASISGPGGVGISGFKSVDVSSLAVGIKGHKDASMFGGLTASVKSLAGHVQIQSDLKGVMVTGKSEVKVSCESGPAVVSGETVAQLTAVNGMAYVHGKSGAYVGAGVGEGFGMVIGSQSLRVGLVSRADKLDEALVKDPGKLLKIDKQGVTLMSKGSGSASMLELRGGKVLGTGQAIDLDADGNIKLATDSKVLIG